jgi:hypothetical protein
MQPNTADLIKLAAFEEAVRQEWVHSRSKDGKANHIDFIDFGGL